MSDYRIKGATGDWEVVIGLEVHAQVRSNAKLFSGAATAFGAEPNTQVSLVDAAMPGMLPVPNRECIRQAVRTGLAIDDGDLMAGLGKLVGSGDADDAGAENDDFHGNLFKVWPQRYWR